MLALGGKLSTSAYSITWTTKPVSIEFPICVRTIIGKFRLFGFVLASLFFSLVRVLQRRSSFWVRRVNFVFFCHIFIQKILVTVFLSIYVFVESCWLYSWFLFSLIFGSCTQLWKGKLLGFCWQKSSVKALDLAI
jgi:hypothetical protein